MVNSLGLAARDGIRAYENQAYLELHCEAYAQP